ncbi:MAG: hypothetical protein M1837_004960 [Sclerophora amabilis]|nr:MAG: hypothetical protein M1837_004960 [Sclerophora amabilis]
MSQMLVLSSNDDGRRVSNALRGLDTETQEKEQIHRTYVTSKRGSSCKKVPCPFGALGPPYSLDESDSHLRKNNTTDAHHLTAPDSRWRFDAPSRAPYIRPDRASMQKSWRDFPHRTLHDPSRAQSSPPRSISRITYKVPQSEHVTVINRITVPSAAEDPACSWSALNMVIIIIDQTAFVSNLPHDKVDSAPISF